ncbi:RtcB family protein [bacterium]|nr:RtcB family protein [bacterium]MBU1152972.1 RtcB family protein [bacterium]MBU1782188.1 RtcB family protein [bacterium]MBU2599672.1 RtcB family protein [bacterium]
MNRDSWLGPLVKIDQYRWEIPKSFKEGMRVPGLIYASEKLLSHIKMDMTPEQVANVATLPGIVNYSLAMPDIHWGYGLPIGGVAAFDIGADGIISPGGVGSDINCGVRILTTQLKLKEIKDRLEDLIQNLFEAIPSGIGSKGNIRLNEKELKEVLIKGSKWAVEKGYGEEEDLLHTEEKGALSGADPNNISSRALERGFKQLGTLGSGNHFLEIQVVEKIYEEEIASVFGLEKDYIVIMIHSGSRGLGYQVCEDYLRFMQKVSEKYQISLPDRQLCCAPFNSPEGKKYFSAMAAAANYAWVNRQCIMHWTREVFMKTLSASPRDLKMKLLYDVAHNIGKIEEHLVSGKKISLCVHRKGATRAFPAGHKDIPERYQKVGQPVIVPGDMGRGSFVLVGTDKAMKETFGSACHGAGRQMSRTKALKTTKGSKVIEDLKEKGIIVKSANYGTIAEEMPEAYKDVSEVIDTLHYAGICKKVAKLRPLGVIKG